MIQYRYYFTFQGVNVAILWAGLLCLGDLVLFVRLLFGLGRSRLLLVWDLLDFDGLVWSKKVRDCWCWRVGLGSSFPWMVLWSICFLLFLFWLIIASLTLRFCLRFLIFALLWTSMQNLMALIATFILLHPILLALVRCSWELVNYFISFSFCSY